MNDKTPSECIHVAYAIDIQGTGAAQFADQLYVSIASMKASMSSKDAISVHILYGNLSIELSESLHKLEDDRFKIEFLKIKPSDMAFMQQFTKQQPGSTARAWCGIVYARLWIAKFLPEVSRCIYIDSDSMVLDSLGELYSWDLGGKSYGMVMGCIPEYGFNSGVILMDLDKIRKDDKWDALREHLAKHALLYFLPDQTAINRFYAGDICELPLKFNYPPRNDIMFDADKKASDAVIWHFYNGGTKPYRFSEADKAKVKWNEALDALNATLR